MTPLKRAFDLASAVFLTAVLWPLIVGVALAILIRDGRPILYLSERMKTPDQGFTLWKFRTMTTDRNDSGVSGGDKVSRITDTGRFLRRYRLDEMPQLWNVFRGDISFVGPRPPLRHYVEKFPEIYGPVLQSRPGLTGLATLAFHRTEERLLAECQTAEETEEVYCRRCVPRKAQLDLIYARRRTVCSDFKLMVATVFRRISLHHRRKA
ncbi:sugar transferase [Pseudoprimorskyibacter insulae]|uniref:Putative sugar transferase EpsL n=1 Tax=Pseudoprimorskyibacter insulae TaxID=1695997 RepID=A0A2R8ATQ7_9RHOB|nr:sugar transferase [Pseudoprimorskyibacter insulae]SPF79431.1 putative sugar transferase EpsL [Pseudoprimorskyibacter insulae]